MPPTRITYVVHQFLPKYFTGTEQYVFAIAKEMQRRGYDVEVFSLDPFFGEADELFRIVREEVSGLPVVRIRYWMNSHRDWGRLEYQHPLVGEQFGAYLDRRQPDCVHYFHLRHLGGNLLSQSRMRDLRILVHLMDYWYLCPAVTLRKSDGTLCDGPPDAGMGCIACQAPELHLELVRDELQDDLRRLAKHAPSPSLPGSSAVRRALSFLERPGQLQAQLLLADHVFSPSHFLKSQYVANGVPSSRISVQNYGIDPASIASNTRADNKELRIGYIGTIAEHKGVHLLVDAVRKLTASLKLEIHGRSSDFESFAASLEATAAGDQRIVFAGEFRRERLGEVLSKIDVLVVPSLWYENTPFVILEAQAARVPVIATDLGGMSEMIRDEIDGELFPMADVDDLARRLQRLVDEPDRLDRYRRNAPSVKTFAENCDDLERFYG